MVCSFLCVFVCLIEMNDGFVGLIWVHKWLVMAVGWVLWWVVLVWWVVCYLAVIMCFVNNVVWAGRNGGYMYWMTGLVVYMYVWWEEVALMDELGSLLFNGMDGWIGLDDLDTQYSLLLRMVRLALDRIGLGWVGLVLSIEYPFLT